MAVADENWPMVLDEVRRATRTVFDEVRTSQAPPRTVEIVATLATFVFVKQNDLYRPEADATEYEVRIAGYSVLSLVQFCDAQTLNALLAILYSRPSSDSNEEEEEREEQREQEEWLQWSAELWSWIDKANKQAAAAVLRHDPTGLELGILSVSEQIASRLISGFYEWDTGQPDTELQFTPDVRYLVLITGSGASSALGRGGTSIPTMPAWQKTLAQRLDRAAPSLSRRVGLDGTLTPEEFESRVGELVRGLPILQNLDRLLRISEAALAEQAEKWRDNALETVTTAVHVLHESLYDLFGSSQFEPELAYEAYQRLLSSLGFEIGQDRLVIATTNYDPSAYMAMMALGGSPNTGFPAVPPYATPAFAPADLIAHSYSGEVPILHLHGAVGWYRAKDGSVLLAPADQQLTSNLGVPVVVTPDPLKDPLNDPTLGELWREFDEALRRATHIMVLGHSLNDQPLVQKLQEHKEKPLLVALYPGPESGSSEADSAAMDETKRRIKSALGHAMFLPMRFGPSLTPSADLRDWFERGPESATSEIP